MALVQLTRLHSASEALVLWSALDARGLPVSLDCWHHYSVVPHFLFSFGGIRLAVPEPCYQEAREIIEEAEAVDVSGICDNCGGTDIESAWSWQHRLGVLLVVAFGAYSFAVETLALMSTPASCRKLYLSCGHVAENRVGRRRLTRVMLVLAAGAILNPVMALILFA